MGLSILALCLSIASATFATIGLVRSAKQLKNLKNESIDMILGFLESGKVTKEYASEYLKERL